jgi:hypothetical protein
MLFIYLSSNEKTNEPRAHLTGSIFPYQTVSCENKIQPLADPNFTEQGKKQRGRGRRCAMRSYTATKEKGNRKPEKKRKD